MRAAIPLALLLAAAPLRAQGYVAGFVLDSATRLPLQCIEVALEDTAGRIVERRSTESDGSFLLNAPARGDYRLRFAVWGRDPLYGPRETLEPTTRRDGQFALAFGDYVGQSLPRTSDTVTDAPLGLPVNVSAAPLRYPTGLLQKRLPGEVLVHFVVDSTGAVVHESVRILRSTHRDFSDAVTRHLREVRFQPALRDHRPTCALMRWPFRFRFDEDGSIMRRMKRGT